MTEVLDRRDLHKDALAQSFDVYRRLTKKNSAGELMALSALVETERALAFPQREWVRNQMAPGHITRVYPGQVSAVPAPPVDADVTLSQSVPDVSRTYRWLWSFLTALGVVWGMVVGASMAGGGPLAFSTIIMGTLGIGVLAATLFAAGTRRGLARRDR